MNETSMRSERVLMWAFLMFMAITLTAFKNNGLLQTLAQQTQWRLSAFHGIEFENNKIRKCEISISDAGFLRYRKTYTGGKQEYFSLNLSRLRSVDYFGSTLAGNLVLHTLEDDVIVQTYNDRPGNIDSMSVRLTIPLKLIEAEDVNRLQQDLFEIKRLIAQ